MGYELNEGTKTDKLNYAGIFELLPPEERSDAKYEVDRFLEIYDEVQEQLLSTFYAGSVSKGYRHVITEIKLMDGLMDFGNSQEDMGFLFALLELSYKFPSEK